MVDSTEAAARVNPSMLVAVAAAWNSWSTWGCSEAQAFCTMVGAEARSAVILGATLSKSALDCLA